MPRIPRPMGLPAPRPLGRPPVTDPTKAVMAAPRIKPTSTRIYGKGGTPYSTGPDMGIRGAGIGYGGFDPNAG
jgi:hypothetical protein